MGELIGITGAIGSGKTLFAENLARVEPNHASYESGVLVAEIGDAFNQALRAELEYATTEQPRELANQVLIWLPDAISEHLHLDVAWSQLQIVQLDTHKHPELYAKLFEYLEQVKQNPKLLEQTITTENKPDYRSLLQWLGGYLVAKVSKTIWYDELMRRMELRDKDKDLVIVSGVRYPSDAEVVRAHGGRVLAMVRPEHGEIDAKDVTEAQRTAIEPDVTVINNGSREELFVVAENVWRDLGANALKQTYRARD